MDEKQMNKTKFPGHFCQQDVPKNRDISTEISTKYIDISTKVFPHKTI